MAREGGLSSRHPASGWVSGGGGGTPKVPFDPWSQIFFFFLFLKLRFFFNFVFFSWRQGLG